MSDVDEAFERVDAAVRYLCAAINETQLPDSATGVAHWALIVDERIYRAGEYVGSGIYAVSKPEQPSYMSRMLIENMHEQISSQRYVDYADDEDGE